MAVTNGCAAASWRVSETLPDFREVSAELLMDGQPVDLMRSEGSKLHSRKLRAFDEPPFR